MVKWFGADASAREGVGDCTDAGSGACVGIGDGADAGAGADRVPGADPQLVQRILVPRRFDKAGRPFILFKDAVDLFVPTKHQHWQLIPFSR